VLEVARHDGSDAAERLRRACDVSASAALEVRYASDVTRRACELQANGAWIEVALDEGCLVAGEQTRPIGELELELKSGDPQALFELARTWTEGRGLWLDTRSKAARGRALTRGHDHGEPVKAATPPLERGMSGPVVLREVLRSTLDQVLANASEVAAGSTAEEHVHQLRVGLRRLRTALRELDALDPGIDRAWQAPLAETFAQLGRFRDDDTVAKAVRPLLVQSHAPQLDWAPPSERADPVASVRDARFQGVLLDLLRFALVAPADAGGMAHDDTLLHVRERLSLLHRRVAKAGKRFEALAPQDQHRIRKRLKRLRYLAEFVAPLWPDKRVKRYLEHLGPAQDALGRHNDVAVAAERFRADAENDPRSWYSAGLLQGHLRITAREAHDALAEVADAKRFWKH
jgi:inorganic triphosphatase YgiF